MKLSIPRAVVQMELTTGGKSYLKLYLTLVVAWDTQAAQVEQLIQDGTSVRAVARRFAVSVSVASRAWRNYRETDWYIRRRAGRQQPSSVDRYLGECVCSNGQKQTPWGWEGQTSTGGGCACSPTPCRMFTRETLKPSWCFSVSTEKDWRNAIIRRRLRKDKWNRAQFSNYQSTKSVWIWLVSFSNRQRSLHQNGAL